MKKLLIGLVVALGFGAGGAATIQGSAENCMYLAYNFDNMARFRDSGVSWVDAKLQVVSAIADSMTNPQGLVRDHDDAVFVLGLAEKLWNGEMAVVPPGVVGIRVYDLCMGAKKKGRMV